MARVAAPWRPRPPRDRSDRRAWFPARARARAPGQTGSRRPGHRRPRRCDRGDIRSSAGAGLGCGSGPVGSGYLPGAGGRNRPGCGRGCTGCRRVSTDSPTLWLARPFWRRWIRTSGPRLTPRSPWPSRVVPIRPIRRCCRNSLTTSRWRSVSGWRIGRPGTWRSRPSSRRRDWPTLTRRRF